MQTEVFSRFKQYQFPGGEVGLEPETLCSQGVIIDHWNRVTEIVLV